MYEVELKVRADHGTVRDRLDELGAERDRRLFQEDTYYNAPDRDFAETDEALRIRRVRPDGVGDEEATARVTYKGPLLEAESKSREEFETGVDDGGTMDRILQGLGYDPTATVSKDREEYSLEDYTVTLDRVEGLGEFVEVEIEIDSADIEDARDGGRAVLDRLDLDPDEQIQTSYLGLLLAEE
jgi:adenylate cyclase class 2